MTEATIREIVTPKESMKKEVSSLNLETKQEEQRKPKPERMEPIRITSNRVRKRTYDPDEGTSTAENNTEEPQYRT